MSTPNGLPDYQGELEVTMDEFMWFLECEGDVIHYEGKDYTPWLAGLFLVANDVYGGLWAVTVPDEGWHCD